MNIKVGVGSFLFGATAVYATSGLVHRAIDKLPLSDKRREQLHFALPLIATIGVTAAGVHFYPVGFALRCAVFGACSLANAHPKYSLNTLFIKVLGTAALYDNEMQDQYQSNIISQYQSNIISQSELLKFLVDILGSMTITHMLHAPNPMLLALYSPAGLVGVVATDVLSKGVSAAYAAYRWKTRPTSLATA